MFRVFYNEELKLYTRHSVNDVRRSILKYVFVFISFLLALSNSLANSGNTRRSFFGIYQFKNKSSKKRGKEERRVCECVLLYDSNERVVDYFHEVFSFLLISL